MEIRADTVLIAFPMGDLRESSNESTAPPATISRNGSPAAAPKLRVIGSSVQSSVQVNSLPLAWYLAKLVKEYSVFKAEDERDITSILKFQNLLDIQKTLFVTEADKENPEGIHES